MFFFAFFVQVFLRLPCVSVRRKTNQNEYELKKQINVKNNNNNNINTIRKKYYQSVHRLSINTHFT